MAQAVTFPYPAPRVRWKSVRRLALIYLVAGIAALFMLAPVIWLVLTAFRPPIEITSVAFNLLPQQPTFDNFVQVFTRYDLAPYLRNSIIVAVGTVITNLIIGPPAAYTLARYTFRGEALFMVAIIFFRMIPLFAILVPLFLVFSRLDLLDTHAGLILAQTAFKLPFTIWLLRSFFLGIPRELEEAARIDGSSTLGALFRISLPLIRPGLAAAAVFAFLQTWNDLSVSLVLSNSIDTATLPLGLSRFVMEYGIAWGPMSAAGVLMFVPVVLFVFGAERFLVQGLSAGSVKE
jgi:ABC-type glycerol-3-phosphate transport system permease component